LFQEFTGNADQNPIARHPLSNPFKAKFVRVYTTYYYDHKAIRVDFNGFAVGE